MSTSFRDAMIAAMETQGVGATDLSKQSGVSKGQIDKLCQRRAKSTNVDDGIKIAQALGATVEGLCRGSSFEPHWGKERGEVYGEALSAEDENIVLRRAITRFILASENGGRITIS